MAVINNSSNEIGDILIIKTQISVRGDISLTGFEDEILGETTNRFFNKTFRYSKNNLKYSDWLPLSNPNIQLITGDVFGLLFFEFRYERDGSDSSGVLEFNNIQISGNIDIQVCNRTSTVESIFSDLSCDNSITSEIAHNLLKKIYLSGIIPEFVERGEDVKDDDFISFWSAVCFFMSMIISFNNRFDEIFIRRDYLVQSLTQRGMIICGEETILGDLQNLALNFKDEVRKRGTYQITKEKGSPNDFNNVDTLNRGELLRLICKNHFDEFLFELIRKENRGYYIDNSSPLYNGTNYSNQINKTEENTEDFIDLTKYETLGTPTIQSGELEIRGGVGLNGLGYNLSSPPAQSSLDNLITIDTNLDYEITFRIKRSLSISNFSLKFGVTGYNRNGINKVGAFKSIENGIGSNNLFLDLSDATSLVKITDEWYFVRGIIYAENSVSVSALNSRLNVNLGNNLSFETNNNINNLKISLYTESTDNTKFVRVSNLKMRPLIRGRNILTKEITVNGVTTTEEPYILNPQFIQSGGIILSWMKNNSEERDEDQTKNHIEKYLIPYQHQIETVFLTPEIGNKQLLS